MPEEIKKDQDTSLDEIKKQLNGIAGWVQTKKEESAKSGVSWGWITAAIASILAFVAMAFMAYEAWKKGREIAALKHKVDVDEEMKKQAEINVKISTEEHTIKSQKDFIKGMEKQIDSVKREIADIDKERLLIHDKISKVTSWEDLDSYLSGKK
jgi:septal ring factor EnvC (AmiA/AmiB activator)